MSHQNKQMPRDVLVVQALLKEMGVTSNEPRVVSQMLEYVYRYVTTVVEEARVYSSYAKKKMIDADDIKLAIKMVADKSYSTVPPRDMLLEVAKQKNSIPLPQLKACSGLRLPPDRFCLTQPNYKLQFYKRAIASSSSQSPSATKSQTASGVFKTPSNLPPRPSTTSGIASGSTPTFRVLGPAESSQPTIQFNPTASNTPTSVPTIRSANEPGISVGVKRKLAEEPDDSLGSF